MYYMRESVFERNGQKCVKKGYVLKVESASRFRMKCKAIGEPETRIIERLIDCFIRANGWGPQCKQPPFFENNANAHVRDAVNSLINEAGFYD